MDGELQILGADGKPMRQGRAMALAGGGGIPHDAADIYAPHTAEWVPYLWSSDATINMFRDRMVARMRDLVRNDGWASGAVTRVLDNAVGANFRPIAKPDYRALAAMTGIAAFDAAWAEEYGRAADAFYRAWANDDGRYCDGMRKLTMPQMLRLAFRHKIVDGDALAQMLWLPKRVGYGRARYCTSVQIIDPDRLSNPQLRFDVRNVRGGVQIDEPTGAPVGYHIRRAHATDWFVADKSVTWDYIERETPWGRPIIVHDYDFEQANQHRGVGVLGPVVYRLKALIKYDGAELDAAILNAVFGAYIESPHDPSLVESALGEQELPAYQQMRGDYHREKRLSLNGARMPILFPGEKLNTVNAARPTSNFADFEKAVLRNFAAAAGLSAQQVSQDWSDVNYSSARGALLEAWKTLDRRRADFAVGFAGPIRGAVLEELHAVEDMPLPAGAPDFAEARGAYARALWVGPPRGWVDPVAEREGAVLGMEAGLSTLEAENLDQSQDWEEILDQRQRELAAFKARGLEPPASWLANRPAAMPGGAQRDPAREGRQ